VMACTGVIRLNGGPYGHYRHFRAIGPEHVELPRKHLGNLDRNATEISCVTAQPAKAISLC
jgi:hypothetical protein